MPEKKIIGGFQPGMHLNIVPQNKNEGTMDFIVNMESLPGRGIRPRVPIPGFLKEDPLGGYKISAWAEFDGAIWFVTYGAASDVISKRVYQLKDGIITAGQDGSPELVGANTGLQRDFTVPWHMTVTGDQLVFTSGIAFFDGDEATLAPFYIQRRVTESGSLYYAYNGSITDRTNYGDGMRVTAIPYLETPLHPDCMNTGYEDVWSDNDRLFSAALPAGTRVRVVMTAIVSRSEYIIHEETIDLGITSDPFSRLGSGRALRFKIPSDTVLPVDTTRIRYYRAIGVTSEELANPSLLAEWPVASQMGAASMAMSYVAQGDEYDTADEDTFWCLSGGVNLYYTCSAYDYDGCPMVRGYPNPYSLWPSGAYGERFGSASSWLASGAPSEQAGGSDIGKYPMAGFMPVVAWWDNPTNPTDELTPIGVATLPRFLGYASHPKFRGMKKPVYDAGDSQTQRVWGTGSKVNEGAMMWTGQLSFMLASTLCGRIGTGKVRSQANETTAHYNPQWAFSSDQTNVLDYAGLDGDPSSPVAPFGIVQGITGSLWDEDTRELPWGKVGALNYAWDDPYVTSLSNLDLGGFTLYWQNTTPTYPLTHSISLCGFGKFAYAMLNADAAIPATQPAYRSMHWAVTWDGLDDLESGPVGKLGLAVPIDKAAFGSTGTDFLLCQPSDNGRFFKCWQWFSGAAGYTGFYPLGGFPFENESLQDWMSTDGSYYQLFTDEYQRSVSRATVTVVTASNQGNDTAVRVVFTAAPNCTLDAPFTNPVAGDFVVNMRGPWYENNPNITITTGTFTDLSAGGIPSFQFDFIIRGLIDPRYTPDMRVGQDSAHNILEVSVPFVTNSGAVTTWTVRVHPFGQFADGNEDGGGLHPEIKIWGDAAALTKEDILSASGTRFLFWKPRYESTDLDGNDYTGTFDDQGFGLPVHLRTDHTDYDLSTTGATQSAVNTALHALGAFSGGSTGYGKRYRDSCIESLGEIAGFVLRQPQIRNFTEALGLVGLSATVYDTSGNQIGNAAYPVISASEVEGGTELGGAYRFSVLVNSAFTSDGDWSPGSNYLLKFSRTADSTIHIIDDLLDVADGNLFSEYDHLSDASFGFYAEVGGVSYFGAIKSEINPSESGKSFIRWNLTGGPLPDMAFDRIKSDSAIRAMVGADNILWVFTDKSVTGYIHTGDLPTVAFKFVGKTVESEQQVFVYEDKVFFVNEDGFYRANREGVEELSFTNRDIFKLWVSEVGVSNIIFGADQIEAEIFLNAHKTITSATESAPFAHWVFDTKTDTMKIWSWNAGVPIDDPPDFNIPTPTWDGYSTFITTNQESLVSILVKGAELLAPVYYKKDAGSLEYGVLTNVEELLDVNAATLDDAFAFRRKLVIGDPSTTWRLVGVVVKLEYGVNPASTMKFSFMSDLNRGSDAARHVVLTTSDSSTVVYQPCNMPFRELSWACSAGIEDSMPEIEYIQLHYTKASDAFDGNVVVYSSTIYGIDQ